MTLCSSLQTLVISFMILRTSISVTGFVTHEFVCASPRAFQGQRSCQLSAFQVSPMLRFRGIPQPDQSDATSSQSSDELIRETEDAQRVERLGQSMSLIRAIGLNQAAIFLMATIGATLASFSAIGGVDFSSFHWAGDSSFHSIFDWRMDELRVAEGFLATIPMVMLGCAVEQSDRRDASHVNFSTTNMCISLFGRRKSVNDPEGTDSKTVMALAALIALSTGISEEILFRGYIPTGIEALTASLPLAVLGQALLFALAHVSPKSSPAENKLVGGLQFVNGMWYGAVYVATGGDILPCIIAHALYDSHILCETWSSINNQMDYTQDAFKKSLDAHEMEALVKIQQQAGPGLSSETLNLSRRFFYAFDYEHKGSLCLSDVHRAVNYAFLNDRVVPEQDDVERVFDNLIQTRAECLDYPGDRLTVSEFLRLLFALKSRRTIPV